MVVSIVDSLSHRFVVAFIGMAAGILGCWVSDIYLSGYRGTLPLPFHYLLGLSALGFLFVFGADMPLLAVMGFIVFGLTAAVAPAAWLSKTV
jgi:sugar phosphate permease